MRMEYVTRYIMGHTRPSRSILNTLNRMGKATVADLWQSVQNQEGIKSKQHMKNILKTLKSQGRVQTEAPLIMKKGNPFVYYLTKREQIRLAQENQIIRRANKVSPFQSKN
eukprot:gb/GECH01012178.1/.p1 GENE.gb/GECH01012178.1/~~gb/GECH01012178.1/.p1  ORF type:complete len:111 (+),score=21.14 gb/GECH01012178.1/:1-333(+)